LLHDARRGLRAAAIGDYIDGFYNPNGRHSAIDYVSPIEFELKFLNEKTNRIAAYAGGVVPTAV